MPFDIFTTDIHAKPERAIRLGIDEYDLITEKICNLDNLFLFKKVFEDYYGEAEVYINELESLKSEITILKNDLSPSESAKANKFLNDFSNLVDIAIEQRRTIKFVGD
jgi:hypothetical protein